MLQRLGIQYKNTNSLLKEDASDVLVTGMQAVLAEYDNVLKAERTRMNMTRHAKDGYRMHKAPYGLRNTRDALNRPIVEPVPYTSDLIADLLNQFSKGIINIRELLSEANSNGLVRENGQPMNYQLLGKILRNPLYAGYESGKLTDNQLIKSNFDGIISLHTFNINQSLLKKHKNHKTNGYVVNSPDFPLRRFVSCSNCSKPLRGSSPKGQSGKSYPKYHCSTKGCKQPSISNETLHEQFVKLLKDVELSEPAQKLYKILVLRAWNDEVAHMHKARHMHEVKLSGLEKSKHLVFDKYLRDEVTLEEKNEYFERVNQQISVLNSKIMLLGTQAGSKQEAVDYGIAFMASAAEAWQNAGVDTQMQLQNMMFPTGLTYNLTDQNFGTFKMGALYRLAAMQKGTEVPEVSALVISRRIELRLPG